MTRKVIYICAGLAAVVLVANLLLGLRSGLFVWRKPVDVVAVKEAEYQKRIDELTERNRAIEAEMTAAKRESAAAYQRAQANAKTAHDWMLKYQQADADRKSMRKAANGGEAVSELRKMGWIK